MTATLFDTEPATTTDQPAKKKRPDLWNLYLIEKHSLPADWCWFESSCEEMPDGYFKITGSVPRSYRKNGSPVWGKASKATERILFIEQAAYDAGATAWEVTNDTCRRCFGDGRQWRGFSTDRVTQAITTTYKPCPCGREPQGPLIEIRTPTEGR